MELLCFYFERYNITIYIFLWKLQFTQRVILLLILGLLEPGMMNDDDVQIFIVIIFTIPH